MEFAFAHFLWLGMMCHCRNLEIGHICKIHIEVKLSDVLHTASSQALSFIFPGLLREEDFVVLSLLEKKGENEDTGEFAVLEQCFA